MTTLRPYQTRDVERIRAEFGKGARRVCYVAPTGSGKTVLFTYIARHLAEKNRRAWIVVHRQELLAQASRALIANDVPHGLVSPAYTPDYRAAVHAATIQTLTRRMNKMPPVDLIILDECHHAVSRTWSAMLAHRPEAKVLGVTATPCRLDGKGLGSIFDAMVIGPRVRELIDGGYLAPFRAFAPPNDMDLTGVHMVAGDYNSAELEQRVSKPTITGSAVAEYLKTCRDAPAIAFCISVAHAEAVAAKFREAGISSYSVDGTMNRDLRRARINGLADGSVRVLTSCELVSEGLDIPAVAAAILIRPTKSLSMYRQQVGRALRPSEGKTAIILDHVRNVENHGLPDEEPEWTLDGQVKRAKKAADDEPDVVIRQCPMCYCVHAPAPQCPECGHEYESQRAVIEKPGELVEYQSQPREKMPYREVLKLARKASTLGELRVVAAQAGYKRGWAWHMWQMRNERNKSQKENPQGVLEGERAAIR